MATGLVCLAALTLLPSEAWANGRVAQFVRQVAGPYEIALGTVPNQPVVGPLHMTMTVTEVASDEPMLDAEVVVTGVGPEPEPGRGGDRRGAYRGRRGRHEPRLLRRKHERRSGGRVDLPRWT